MIKEFTQVNSLQKVPALKDGDFLLSERCPPSLLNPKSTWPPPSFLLRTTCTPVRQ